MQLLFTGASGFLGQNIKPMLEEHYQITTIGLADSDDIKANLALESPSFTKPFDVVLHAAGKAHFVPKTEAECQAFYDVNYGGTVNLCKALEAVGCPKAFIFISTVAVYGLEAGEDISEDAPLSGTSPYAKSKIMAERYLTDWCAERGVTLSIIRPSLIAGPNPPGNLGAMIKGIATGRYLSIGAGAARKSVLMVQDIATLVPLLAERGGVFNVCDDSQPTFRELERTISSQLGKRLPLSIPMWFARCLAFVGNMMGRRAPINSDKLAKITQSLTFSNRRIKDALNWQPTDVISNFKIR
ncbi:MAG: NAD-dependent epimerase/dehydratase family protein [Alistipes sp.]|nr:NAD-dependent epimerase/dehydratase family protein [Alistipes sp.]